MNLMRNKLGIIYLSILLGFLALIGSAEAQSGRDLNLESRQVPWSQLSFHAKNFWVEVSTEIQLRYLRASELDAVLPASSRGIPIRLKASQAAELAINTIIDSRFRSPVKIYNCIWFDPADETALGRIRLRRGEDDFKKSYRFTDRGVFRHRIEPKDKREAGFGPSKWTDVKDTFYPYDTNQLNCPVVSERSVPIYIISAAADLEGNESLSLCVFGKRQLHRVRLKKEGALPVKVNYIKEKQQVETMTKGEVMAHRFTLTARSIESGLEDAETFSFLGFQKDIAIDIEPASGLPIQVSGVIPTVGKAILNLQKVRLKP